MEKIGSPIEFLYNVFNEAENTPAFVYQGDEYSYAWFLEKIRLWSEDIISRKCNIGTVIGVSGDYSPSLCALILALVDQRMIVVPLASVHRTEKDELRALAEVEFEYVFDANGEVEVTKYQPIVNNELLRKFKEIHQPGLVVFSSGTTGIAKGILHDFTKILEKFKIRKKQFRTLTFLQIDHLGGINTLLYALSNAGTIVNISSRSPHEICQAVEKYQVETLPVTPSFLNLLLASGEFRKWDLSSIKLITYGTEVMPSSTLSRMRTELPNVKFQQTYGLSELGVLRTKSKEDGSLWVKVGGEGFQTKVIDDVLWIKAESAMVGYLNAPNPFDAEGWFNTDDKVEQEGEYIKILGRQSDLINVAGQKVYPSEVENVLMQVENVKDALVTSESNLLVGNLIIAKILTINPEDPDILKRRITQFCKQQLSPYKIPKRIEIVDYDVYGSRFKKMRKIEIPKV